MPARREGRDLEQPQAYGVLAVLRALKRAPLGQLASQAERGWLWQPGANAQGSQRESPVPGPEGRQYPERPVKDRLAMRGPPAL